ncbi:MAG: hypothetical protein WDN07_02330 [Actinomycetota bacterium]
MESTHLKLELFTRDRVAELFTAVGTDPEVYRWLPIVAPTNLEEFATIMEGYIQDSEKGIRVMHAVILKLQVVQLVLPLFLISTLHINHSKLVRPFTPKITGAHL